MQEGLHRITMQQLVSNRTQINSGGNPPPPTTQIQTIIITAITLFALSGLMAGFAFGAFVRPQTKQQPITTARIINTPIVAHKITPQPNQNAQYIPLGCPQIGPNSSVFASPTQNANGGTYSFTTQAQDKSAGACSPQKNKPVQADGITCRLWLIKSSDQPLDIPEDRLKNVNNLADPLPNEVSGALVFDNTTSQTQNCNKGQGAWKYQIAPTAQQGQYLMMVLTDWNGKYYNWSWITMTIKQGN